MNDMMINNNVVKISNQIQPELTQSFEIFQHLSGF